jgi:hypothetical protein
VGPLSGRHSRPQVADEGQGLHVRRVSPNTCNKQSRVSDKEFSCSLGVGWGLTPPHYNKAACYEMLHRASKLGRFLERFCEQGEES